MRKLATLLLSVVAVLSATQGMASSPVVPVSSVGVEVGEVVEFKGVGMVFFAGQLGSSEVYFSRHDEPSIMNWTEAEAACQRKGRGWRLPRKAEIELVLTNNRFIDLYEVEMVPVGSNFYWTTNRNEEGRAEKIRVIDGQSRFTNIRFHAYVRCVRSY